MRAPPLYAFKLGPIPTLEGSFTAYVGLTPDEMFPPIFTTRAAEAMHALAGIGMGRPLLCEPALARAGKAFGFQPAPAPDWVVAPRAVLAFGLSLGPSSVALQQGPVLEFLHAAAAFVRASPWRFFDNGDLLEVEVAGALEARFEASVMGAGGLEFGLALYEGKGTVARLARESQARRDVSWLDSIAVTLDDAPASAMKALRDAVDLPGLPVPVRVRGGKPGMASVDDLALLAAALRAVLQLDEVYTTATASLTWGAAGSGRRTIQVTARAAEDPER